MFQGKEFPFIIRTKGEIYIVRSFDEYKDEKVRDVDFWDRYTDMDIRKQFPGTLVFIYSNMIIMTPAVSCLSVCMLLAEVTISFVVSAGMNYILFVLQKFLKLI